MQADFIMSRSFIWCDKSFVGVTNALPITIESLTRNAELVKTLNHFESGVSSMLLEIDTVLPYKS